MVLEEFLSEWNAPTDCVLVHTSGSTGAPKPMWVEKTRMRNSARITCDFLGLTAEDRALLCMNLDYIGAKMMVVRSIERHMTLIDVPATGHPFQSLTPDQRQEGHITFAAMVPLQVYNSLQVPEEASWLKSINHLIIGGGAVDDHLSRQLKDFPHHVWSTYGMTETLSHIALRQLNGVSASDYYQPFDSVKISLNEEGCLVIEAPLVHEGQLVTNDRAEIVPGKGFRILGRKDNVIVSGGVKIQIEEVEKSLAPFLSSPYIISKRPHEKFGEEVVLLTEATDLAEVSEICMNALPKYWVPRHYIHVDKLPMTETGKPARKGAERLALS